MIEGKFRNLKFIRNLITIVIKIMHIVNKTTRLKEEFIRKWRKWMGINGEIDDEGLPEKLVETG